MFYLPYTRTRCYELNDPERQVCGNGHQHDLQTGKVPLRLLEQEQSDDEVFLLWSVYTFLKNENENENVCI